MRGAGRDQWSTPGPGAGLTGFQDELWALGDQGWKPPSSAPTGPREHAVHSAGTRGQRSSERWGGQPAAGRPHRRRHVSGQHAPWAALPGPSCIPGNTLPHREVGCTQENYRKRSMCCSGSRDESLGNRVTRWDCLDCAGAQGKPKEGADAWGSEGYIRAHRVG